MYVSGIDLSCTATAVAIASIGDGPHVGNKIVPSIALIGAAGIEAMPAKLALATLDELARQIVSAAIPVGLVVSGPVNPELVIIERPIGSNASRGVFERGYLWFTVVRELLRRGVEVLDVYPQTLKTYGTGKGNSGKGAMIDAVGRRFPMFETGGDDNKADAAIACALAAAVSGWPMVELPKTHLAAVDAANDRRAGVVAKAKPRKTAAR